MQKILLLHGALGSAENFKSLEQLLQNDFEVHTITFNGHGKKDISENSFGIAHFANEVIVYLEKHKIQKISVFGYSMGGYVGLYLLKFFPEKISKLYTLATKLNWTIESSQKDASMLNPTIIKEKVPKHASYLQQLHGDNWDNLMNKTAEMMLDLGKNPPIKNDDFEEIMTPVLLSIGDKDAMVSIEETTDLYRKLKNAQLYVMPNTMHPLEKVNIDELAHQIKRFILS